MIWICRVCSLSEQQAVGNQAHSREADAYGCKCDGQRRGADAGAGGSENKKPLK